MKARLALVLSFACGAAFASLVAVAVVLLLVRWNGQQSRLFWTTYLHNYANDALRLSRGEPGVVLRDMEDRLPGVVLSVHSFGETDATRGALHRAREFYRESGKPMPPEIAGILSAPRL